MAEQWIRAFSLTVDGAGGSLDLSTLRVKFEIRQDTIQTPNNLIARVYNLSAATAQKVKASVGGTCTLVAGYESNAGQIFKGDIKQVLIGRENPVDTFCDIYVASGDMAYNQGKVSKTLAAGSTMLDHVNVMAEAMKPFGIKLGYVPTQLLQQFKYPRAVTLYGMAKTYLRTISHSIGATWSIQDDELRMVESGKSLGGTRKLNSQTGLIGMPQQTADGIIARCLIDPQITVHSTVQINQADINMAAYDFALTGPKDGSNLANETRPDVTPDGLYTVYVRNAVGDTRGKEWYFDLILIAQGGRIPVGSSIGSSPSALAGVGSDQLPFTPQEE